MSSYFQTTIHSRNSKFEKTSGDGMGKLFKGTLTGKKNIRESRQRINNLEDLTDLEQVKQQNVGGSVAPVQEGHIKQNKQNSRRQKRQVNKNNVVNKKGVFVGQSEIFPAIIFKKTTMREVFKEFTFPHNCKALSPTDQKCSLIFQIIGNLFSQITFYIFNLLIAQNSISKGYFIFFSDSETIPYTKCCTTPAYIELHPNGTGRILCNSKNCEHPSLAQFLISYQDSTKLWSDMTYLQEASEIDKEMKVKISKFIKTGQYKKRKLQSLINDTSRQVARYYSSKKQFRNIQSEQETPFLTDIQSSQGKSHENLQNEENLLSPSDRQVDLLKAKLEYITRKNKEMSKKINKGLIEEGKVFNKKFELPEKLEEMMETQQGHKTLSKMTFPRLIQKLKVREKSKTRTKSRNKSFLY